jgi:hypothetical protein
MKKHKYAIGDIVMIRRDRGPQNMYCARVLWLNKNGIPSIVIDVSEKGEPLSLEARQVSQPWHVTPLTDEEKAGIAPTKAEESE